MTELLIFPHSHFCEKARWALDYKNVNYSVKALVPGVHVFQLKKLGCKSTSVPVLVHDKKVIEGSGSIIDYIEVNFPGNSLSRGLPESNESIALENQLDFLLGESLRVILYSTLLQHKEFIKDCFTHQMQWFSKFVFQILSPLIRSKISQKYLVSQCNIDQAFSNFEQGLSVLKGHLQSNKYIYGEEFTRVDLSVASMLSLAALPSNHPFPWNINSLPCEKAKEFVLNFQETEINTWVHKMYNEHR